MLLRNKKPEAPGPVAQKPRQPLAPRSSNKEIKTTKSDKKQIAANEPQISGSDIHATIMQLKRTLEDRLNAVLELLDLEHGHQDMCCAADLVAFAMDVQWLGEQDFFSA